MSLLDHMCPKCDYYMPLTKAAGTQDPSTGETLPADLERSCRYCGYTQQEKKGLVMEMVIQESAADTYRVFVDEHTKNDVRLPHLTTLKCPNGECPSRGPGGKSDVIYIKYDNANMKFLYICNVCNTQWRNRS